MLKWKKSFAQGRVSPESSHWIKNITDINYAGCGELLQVNPKNHFVSSQFIYPYY